MYCITVMSLLGMHYSHTLDPRSGISIFLYQPFIHRHPHGRFPCFIPTHNWIFTLHRHWPSEAAETHGRLPKKTSDFYLCISNWNFDFGTSQKYYIQQLSFLHYLDEVYTLVPSLQILSSRYPSFHNECTPQEKCILPGAPPVNIFQFLTKYTLDNMERPDTNGRGSNASKKLKFII